MDIRVLARATTARRWLLVNVVDNSQCARAVKAFVRRSCRTNSTGNLCSNCVAGSPGGSRCVCQVGKSSDMYPDHRFIPINTIINYRFRHIYQWKDFQHTSFRQYSERYRNHWSQKSQLALANSIQIRIHSPRMQKAQQQLCHLHRCVWLTERTVSLHAISYGIVTAPTLTYEFEKNNITNHALPDCRTMSLKATKKRCAHAMVHEENFLRKFSIII